MHSVFPLRTAPSQMIASRFLSGDFGPHQLITRFCFSENRLIFNPRTSSLPGPRPLL